MTKLKGLFGKVLISILLILLLVGVGGVMYWSWLYQRVSHYAICSDPPVETISSSDATGEGLPYWLWLVLPRLFPKYLPGSGGYTALGVNWEAGQELPIGFSKQVIGFPEQATTFIQCHDSAASEEDTLSAATRFNLPEYLDFFETAASDSRFTADYIINSSNGISYVYDLSWLDEQIYRWVIIPATREMLLSNRVKNIQSKLP